MTDQAVLTMHTTARQAATIAMKAAVGTLVTGHYSSRFQDLNEFLDEAREVFPNTVLGLEGEVYEVPQQK